jgi:outer membrane lipoprotein SlyB
MVSRFVKAVSVVSMLLIVSACARNLDPNVYSDRDADQVSDTFQGVVLSSRPVTVGGADSTLGNTTGLVVGGIAGGLAGNQIGNGSGQVAATVGGALVVAALGAVIQGEMSKQPGIEYIIKIWDNNSAYNTNETVEDYRGRVTKRNKESRRDNERVLTIVQGPQSTLEVGQRVFVIVQNNGRSRVIVDNSGTGVINAKKTGS